MASAPPSFASLPPSHHDATMPITTRLSQLLKVRVPVVCAPMAGAAGGALAASVTRGGGFGFIAGGHPPLASLLKEIDIGRKALSLSAGEKLP